MPVLVTEHVNKLDKEIKPKYEWENGNLIIFVLQIRSVMEGTYYWIVLLEQMERECRLNTRNKNR